MMLQTPRAHLVTASRRARELRSAPHKVTSRRRRNVGGARWSEIVWVPGLLLTPALLAAASVDDLETVVNDDGVEVCWTTPVAARCQVEYGPTAALGAVVDENPADLRGSTNAGNDSGVGYANNHRARLPLPAAWPLWVKVTGQTGDGAPFAGEPTRIDAPAPPVGTIVRDAVQLRLDRGGWALGAVPVTLGIPFPPGHLADGQHVRILAGETELPCQTFVVTRWRADRSIKWLRVSFEAPPGDPPLRLEYGTEVVPAAPPPGENDGVAGRDGVLSFRLPGATSLVQVAPRLIDAEGESWQLDLDRVEWRLEESGPVTSVYAGRAPFVNAAGVERFAAMLRLHRFAGQPWARLDFTFENNVTAEDTSRLRALYLELPGWAHELPRVGMAEEAVTLNSGQRLLQREDFEWVLSGPAGELQKGRRMMGVVTSGASRVILRHFWEQYPAAVSLDGETLRLELYPALPDGYYANRPDEEKLYFHLRDGLYTFRQGFTKTHTLWFDLSGDPAAETLALDPPTVTAPPRWIERSGALRDLCVERIDRLPPFDPVMIALADRYPEYRDRAREYGLMNFGDWFGERTWNWGNLEYDLGHAFLTQYARTGHAAFFHRATEMLRHQGDVDTRHYADDPRRVGQQWIHSMGHTAGYYPRDYKGMELYSSPGWSDNRGHVWAQGLFEHYLLGGERRSFETARLIADWAAGPQTTNFRFYNAREPGWMLILVMSAYNATEDPFYLNAARLMLREVRRLSEATGDRGFHYHTLPRGHCDCPEGEKHVGEAGFMLGVQMTGMKMAYDALGDERIADDIVKIARFIVETMWVPEERAFRYTSCPKTSASKSTIFILLEGLAFAAGRSGDAELARVTRQALAASWGGIAGAGKSAGYELCSLAQGLEQFARLPGPSLAEEYADLAAWLRSPARRPVPGLVPNGDFEEDLRGWRPRPGVTAEPTPDGHRGTALRLVADGAGQNEYVNTVYDTGGDPFELVGLAPGRAYRLDAWLKVLALSPGAPAPSLRIQTRDNTGSRGSFTTNAYDLAALGTWQRLSVEFTLPDWNTRNYLALNTNTRDPVQAELVLDDVSIVPAAAPPAEGYTTIRLGLDSARLDGLAVDRGERGEWLAGEGQAVWTVAAPAAPMALWARIDGPVGSVAEVLINGEKLGAVTAGDAPAWICAGHVEPTDGPLAIELRLAGGVRVGRVVLTDLPVEE